MISSAVWIGADSESTLSVSDGRLSPIETDKVDSLSDTLHTSAYHTARIVTSRQQPLQPCYFFILESNTRLAR